MLKRKLTQAFAKLERLLVQRDVLRFDVCGDDFTPIDLLQPKLTHAGARG